jgi:hypothetical protein
MDPFIESQKWDDFHGSFVGVLRELLVLRVRPQYLVDVERYVYVTREYDDGEDEVVQIIAPDAFVADTGHGWRESAATAGTATLQPVRHRLRLPRRRQSYLVIRTRRNQAVVTVIELLSPWNKTPESGVAEYLAKRINVLRSTANLVELDLLRGGERLPTVDPLQDGDFYAFVSRPRVRPDVDVYAWTLRDPLPTLPIPLAAGDADVPLDLQAALTTAYDRAGYDYSLDYGAEIQPPLSPNQAPWVRARLASPEKSGTANP